MAKATRKELKVYIQRRGGVDRDAQIERAARALASIIFSTRMANTLRITIKLRSSTMSGDLGYAVWDKVNNVKSKKYTIALHRDLPMNDLLRTLAHELQHIAQYATGRLRPGTKAGERGRFWRADKGAAVFFPLVGTDYFSSPWEVEARSAEKFALMAKVARA